METKNACRTPLENSYYKGTERDKMITLRWSSGRCRCKWKLFRIMSSSGLRFLELYTKHVS
jgi:hypothetical protein